MELPRLLHISLWLVTSWAMAFLLLCVAIHDVQRTSPAQFWPWIKLKPEQLSDVRLYNQENCTMWMACAFLFFVNGIIGVFSDRFSAFVMLMMLFPGGYFLVRRYNRILRRYLIAPQAQENKPSSGK